MDLPEIKIKKGDPYQWQVEETVKKIMLELKDENLDHTISYQSRVGPLKWIGPSTDDEIIKALERKKRNRYSSGGLSFQNTRKRL